MKQIKVFLVALFLLSSLLLFTPFVLCSTGYAEGTVNVYQIWNDAGNLDGIRPEAVPVIMSPGDTMINPSDPVRIPEGPVTFAQLQLPEGYTASGPYISTAAGGGLSVVFINTHIPSTSKSIQNILEEGNLIIEKIAEGAGPDEVFWFDVTFSSSQACSFTTTRGNSGFVSDGIPLHAGEIATIHRVPTGAEYTVKERENHRYLSTGVNSTGKMTKSDTVVTFTNKLITTTFTVYKRWEGTEKDKITLHLFADGEATDYTPERTGNTYTFCNLPKFALDGHEILYSAKEDYMSGYMTMYINKGKYADRSKAVYNDGTIINREVTTFAVHKEWIGTSNPPEIRFQLYQNGKPIEWRQPKKVSSELYIWENLPRMKDGEEAIYSAKEIPVKGFLTRYENHSGVTDCALNGGKIINYKVPITGDRENPGNWLILGIASSMLFVFGIALWVRGRRKR